MAESMTANPACRLAFVTGPSGAGKSHVRKTLAEDQSTAGAVLIDFDTVLPAATLRAFPFFRSWYDSEWSIWKAVANSETWTDRGEKIQHCPMDVVTPFRLAIEQQANVAGTHIYETDPKVRSAGSRKLRTGRRVLVDGSQVTDGWMRNTVANVFRSYHAAVDVSLFVIRPDADQLSTQRRHRGGSSVDVGRDDVEACRQALRSYDSWLSNSGEGAGYADRQVLTSSDEAVAAVRDWWARSD